MMKLIDSFECIGEDDGLTYTVEVFEAQVTHRPSSGRASTVGGRLDYRLADGRDVSPEGGADPQRFEIFDTDQWIRKR